MDYSNPFQYVGRTDGSTLRYDPRKYEGLERVYLSSDRKNKVDDLFGEHASIKDPVFEKKPMVLPRDTGGPMVGYIGDDPIYEDWKKCNPEVREIQLLWQYMRRGSLRI